MINKAVYSELKRKTTILKSRFLYPKYFCFPVNSRSWNFPFNKNSYDSVPKLVVRMRQVLIGFGH